eukprot:c12810_g1_i1.p1 GENE.c12810_g1_i1~~c12810_g1_i1.p1  ORF type:complete len:211 (+),score=77.02 c12810_g1_i1:52-684(+)
MSQKNKPGKSASQEAFIAKILMLGSTGVGKTSLANQYVRGQFFPKTTTTIGAAFLAKNITIEGQALALQVWDTAGSEQYRSMVPLYYRGAHAAILVFDVTSKKSFEDIRGWVDDLKQHNVNNTILGIACNKIDLPNQEVDIKEVKAYADSLNCPFFETSAATGQGISELFDYISKGVFETYVKQRAKTQNGNINVATSPPPKTDNSCCSK